MFSYALRRLGSALPILLGVATLVFFAMQLAPGDPASLYLSPGMSAEALQQIRANLGLDDPLPVQYGRWLFAFVRGDFQLSLVHQIPVRDLILSRLPNTVFLAGSALLLAFLIGILVGVLQAARQNTVVDGSLSAITLFFYSMPSFWLGIMLILVFSVGAKNLWGWPFWLPPSGVTSPGHDLLGFGARLLDRLQHLALPLATLVLALMGGVARYVRSSMLEVIRQDYVRTARAKGLPEARVLLVHALRNALIPVVTLAGLYLPLLLSGAVLIEVVFAWPGVGKLLVDSVLQGDYPVVLALTFFFGATVVVGNLGADLLYGVVDPRIRDDHA